MAEEIRGLSIKFDADFSSFKKGMKNADKDINSTQKQLKNLQNSLDIKWDPKKFTQAQQQAQQAIEATEQKAQLLRERLAAMEKAGVTDKTRDEYNYLSEQLGKTELNAEQLKKQLEKLNETKLNALTSGIDAATKKFEAASRATRGLSIAAGGALAGLAATGLKTVEKADEIATLATTYNMTTDAIQRFNYVALQTDTSADYLYKGFVKVQAGVSDMKVGIESVATKALRDLNLSFDQFSGSEEQFYAIIDALSKMEDQAKMVSVANDIFGEKMATNLFPLIYAGTDAINEYKKEFEDMGSLSEEQVSKLAEFDNVLNQLKTSASNTAAELGSAMLPAMETFTEFLSTDIIPAVRDLVGWFSGLSEGQQKTILSMLALMAVLSPTIRLIKDLSGSISVVIKWLKEMDKATLLTYGKWILLGAAIGSLFSVIANWSNMNPVQRITGLLGALSAAALAAAVAFGVFHSAWSIGIAVAGIVGGIAAAISAVKSAGKDIGAQVSFPTGSYEASVSIPDYNIPQYSGQVDNSTTTNNSSYVDNSNVVINIQQNEYMNEDDIIRAVNKGLKQARQSRS